MLLKDKTLIMVSSVILIICVLLGVAFLTLMERKVLGQWRSQTLALGGMKTMFKKNFIYL